MSYVKKLCFVIDVLEDIKGGAERQIYELVKGINKEKFEVNLFILQQNSIPKEILDLKINVQALGIKRIYDLNGILKGFFFSRFLNRMKIDVLMTYHFGSDVWGAFWGRKAPFIVSNRRDIGFWRKSIHSKAYRFINRWVDVVIVNSEAGKGYVNQDELLPEQKICVIHNGIDLSRFKNEVSGGGSRKALGIQEDEFVIGCLGNLREIKGQRYLVEAGIEVLKEISLARFVFIGDGPDREMLEKISQKSRFLFLGKRFDVPGLLAMMDVCVLPSLSEGLSNAILEYMAAGKPVVATNVGGNSELVKDKVNGILVAPANSKELKEAIIELFKDKTKAARYGLQGKEFVQSGFSTDRMVQDYEKLFSKKTQRRTKILHLISSGGLFGAEKVVLNLAAYGNKNGMNSIVGAVKNYHNPHLEIIDEAKKIGLETVVFDSNGSLDFSTVLKIKHFLRNEHVDIVHSHNYKSDILGFLAVKLAHIKWIATNHVWHGLDFKLRVYEFIDAFILKFADKVVAVSDMIEDELRSKRINTNRLKRIYNGIDLACFSEKISPNGLKKELGVLSDELIITIIGRLSPEKGHAIFLESATGILEHRQNIRFLIVGDGPLKDSLETQVNNSNLKGKVIFTGIRKDIPKVYAISDILVNSSYIEGLPLTILEAMASGVPIVATKVGATPKVIQNNESGILIEPGEPEELTSAVLDLIDNEEKRKMFAANAYKNVCEKFSVERMVSEYIAIYRGLLN